MSIQYTVLGFEPTTFRTRVCSHNHWTRANFQLIKLNKNRFLNSTTPASFGSFSVVKSSVTVSVQYLLFTTMIICPYKSFKVFSIFCQILNNLPKNCQRSFKFCQSGKISPNLVTLVPSNILIGKENFLLWRNSNSDPSEAKSKMFWQLHPRSLNDKTIEIAISKFYIFEH